VPPTPQDVTLDVKLCENIRSAAAGMSTLLSAAVVEAQQSCYLPVSSAPDGLPMVGRVEEVPGLLVASGHSCWGILHGPATGLMIAELLLEGHIQCMPEECVKALSPSRVL
jgi:glycine/D-amino acid oxidase-like deaminating enzyme